MTVGRGQLGVAQRAEPLEDLGESDRATGLQGEQGLSVTPAAGQPVSGVLGILLRRGEYSLLGLSGVLRGAFLRDQRDQALVCLRRERGIAGADRPFRPRGGDQGSLGRVPRPIDQSRPLPMSTRRIVRAGELFVRGERLLLENEVARSVRLPGPASAAGQPYRLVGVGRFRRPRRLGSQSALKEQPCEAAVSRGRARPAKPRAT